MITISTYILTSNKNKFKGKFKLVDLKHHNYKIKAHKIFFMFHSFLLSCLKVNNHLIIYLRSVQFLHS